MPHQRRSFWCVYAHPPDHGPWPRLAAPPLLPRSTLASAFGPFVRRSERVAAYHPSALSRGREGHWRGARPRGEPLVAPPTVAPLRAAGVRVRIRVRVRGRVRGRVGVGAHLRAGGRERGRAASARRAARRAARHAAGRAAGAALGEEQRGVASTRSLCPCLCPCCACPRPPRWCAAAWGGTAWGGTAWGV